MKSIFYIILPVVAILVIFLNMSYGHLLFISASEEVVNKYEVYVHLQPDWNLDQKNILFEVTNFWYKVDGDKDSFEKNEENHNFNQLQYLDNKSYVELKHDFSNCQDEWQPILYRKAIDTVRHEIEYIQGKQISSDPNAPIYPDIKNDSYSDEEQQLMVREGFSQFIPICTSEEKTSYNYSIKTDSEAIGFDVYFVSSIEERANFHESQEFNFYMGNGCYAQNKKSFSGFCENVGKDSGLLIAIPDVLDKPLTKVAVTLKEHER